MCGVRNKIVILGEGMYFTNQECVLSNIWEQSLGEQYNNRCDSLVFGWEQNSHFNSALNQTSSNFCQQMLFWLQ